MTGSGSQYTITVSNCVDGDLAGLVLNSLAVQDAAGNIGPSLVNQTGVTKIDTTAPVLRVTDVTAPGVGGLPIWVFDSEEPATGMSVDKFSFSGTATTCVMNYSVLRENLGWQISLSGCDVGSTQVTLAANSVTDGSGNTGPIQALASNIIEITPDEVINESFDAPEQATGAGVDSSGSLETDLAIEKDRLLGEKDLLVGQGQVTSGSTPLSAEANKGLDTKAKELAFGRGTDLESSLMLAMLVLSLSLSAFAAGRSVRTRRRH
jgi:hypothetical protein